MLRLTQSMQCQIQNDIPVRALIRFSILIDIIKCTPNSLLLRRLDMINGPDDVIMNSQLTQFDSKPLLPSPLKFAELADLIELTLVAIWSTQRQINPALGRVPVGSMP